MNKVYILLLTVFFLLPFHAHAAGPAQTIVSGPGVRTEAWAGKMFGATFRAGMCFEKNGKARGVLILRHANGNEDVYHLYGAYHDRDFDLSHSSGHAIRGSLTSPTTMKGSVKINRGPKLSLEGKRTLNVPLAASDCAPLK